MNYFTTNKYFRWALILLFAINIAALVTIAFKGFRPPPGGGVPPGPPGTIGTEFPDLNKLVREEMKFDENQENKFEELRKNYFESSKPVMDKIRESKLKVIDELGKDNPDRNSIQTESVNIGKYQTELETLNADFFINVSSVCNEQQRKKLQNFLQDLDIRKKPGLDNPPPKVF